MHNEMPEYVLLNGKVVGSQRAKVSVFDRGLLYGDGLFETLRVYDGQVFALDEHLARLHASARFLSLAVPQLDWHPALARLLAKNGLTGNAWIRIVLTRGTAVPSLLPPAHARPTSIVLAGELDPSLAKHARRGVRVELLPFAVEGLLAGHKTLSYVPAMLGKQIARQHGAYEGLYVDARNHLSEGTTSNLFLVIGDTVVTPPLRGILPGVTRGKVIALCRDLGLPVREKPVRSHALVDATEIFLSSSLAEIIPVVRVGEQPIAAQRPGPVTRQLQTAYQRMLRDALNSSEAARKGICRRAPGRHKTTKCAGDSATSMTPATSFGRVP